MGVVGPPLALEMHLCIESAATGGGTATRCDHQPTIETMFFFFPDGTRQAARKSARGQHRYALAQRFVMGEHSLWTCRSQHVTLTAAVNALAKAEHVLTDSGYRISELMVLEAAATSELPSRNVRLFAAA